MWMNHRSVYQDHLKYVCNDIVKPFRFGILHYAERVMDMHDLGKYLPPPSIKGKRYEEDNWKVCDQEFTVSEISVAMEDVLPSYMKDELDNHQ